MERNSTLDILKIILACMVIGQHTAFGIDISQNFGFLTRNGLFRIAVPLFFILNGYFFHTVIDSNFSLWLKRVLTLYLIWMILCLPLWFNLTILQPQNIHNLFENIIFGYYHLWYVVALAGAGIMLKLMRGFSPRTIFISAVTLFLIGITLEYSHLFDLIDSQFIVKQLNTPWTYRNAILFAFPFFTIGYLIRTQNIEYQCRNIPTWLLISVGVTLPVIEAALRLCFFPNAGSTNIYFSLIIAAPMVFFGVNRVRIIGKSKDLATFSSALYFAHPLVIFGVKWATNLHTTQLTCMTILACSIVALFLIVLNRKLKVLL